MNNKPAKQKQPNTFSENWATIPSKKDPAQQRSVSQYREFNTSKVGKKNLKEYLDFCAKVFPNGDNSLGILFNDDIKESKALSFLAQQNYDIVKAKFYLAFPVLYRSVRVHKLNVEISEQEMKHMLEEFKKQKNPAAVSKQTDFFEQIVFSIENRREKVPIQEVRDLLNEASKLKYEIPAQVKQEFSRACDLSEKINELMLRSPKKMSDIELLMEMADKAIILPDNLEKIRTLKARIEELARRSSEFVNNNPKDTKVITQIFNDLKVLGVEPEQVPQFVALKNFGDMVQDMNNLYKTIYKPTRSNSSSEKVTFIQYYSLIEFLITHQVMSQDRVDELVEFVNDRIKMKETCQMFLEDDRNRDYQSFMMIAESLNNCALDFVSIYKRLMEKVDSCKILDQLTGNIDNEKELFRNIELLKACRKRGIRFFRTEMDHYDRILQTLSRIDDIVVEMNTIELTMEQFLFDNVKLPNYNELVHLLNLDCMKERYNNSYLQNMKSFLEAYTSKLNECYHKTNWTLTTLFEAMQELVAYILQDDVKLPTLKAKLVRSLLIEFELVRFLDKFTNTRFKCTYGYWNARLVESARVFNDIKAGFDYFIGSENVRPYTQISMHYPNLMIVYDQYKSISNFVQDANLENLSPENVEQLEKMLTGLVNDPVHTHMLTNAKQVNNIKALLVSYENNRSSKYIEHDDLMQNILIISPDSHKSREFLRKNFGQFLDIYRETQGFNICIDEKDVQEISMYFKRQNGEADRMAVYRNSVEEIKDIIEANHRIYRDYQRFVNKDEDSFILKFPLFVVILYKLSSLGIDTAYCMEIRTFIKYYLELIDFMDLKNKKTLKEMIDISIKLSELRVYLPIYDRFKALLPFARSFVENVAIMETAFRSNQVVSCEVAHNMLKKVKARDYIVSVGKDGLSLKKRGYTLFESADFREQMQAGGKRVKKLKGNLDALLLDDKLARPVHKPQIKILPMVFNQTEQEYCLCREKYEIIGSSMLKYNKCDEWFHRECLKLPKFRMEKVHDDYCIACDFLEGRLNGKLEGFVAGKVTEQRYMEVFKSYMYLKNYLLDEKVDFIDYVHKKMKRMTEGLDLLINEIENLNEKTLKNRVHNLALLYLYLPVRIENIERTLVELYNVNS